MSSLMVIPNTAPDLPVLGSDVKSAAPVESARFCFLFGAQVEPKNADKIGVEFPPSEESVSEEGINCGAADGQASDEKPAAAESPTAHLNRAASALQGQYLGPLPFLTPIALGSAVSTPTEQDSPPSSPSVSVLPSGDDARPFAAPIPGDSSSATMESFRATAPAPTEGLLHRPLGLEPDDQPMLPAAPGRPEPPAPGKEAPLDPTLPISVQQNSQGEMVADFLGYQAVVEVNQAQLVTSQGKTTTTREERPSRPTPTRPARMTAAESRSASDSAVESTSPIASASQIPPVEPPPISSTPASEPFQVRPSGSVLAPLDRKAPHLAETTDTPETKGTDSSAPSSFSSFLNTSDGVTSARGSSEHASSSAPAAKPEAGAVIQQVREAVFAAHDTPTHELIVRLNPPDLGTVRVVVQRHEGVVNATLQVSQPEARELLQRHRDDLHAALEDTGLQVGECTVELGNQMQSRQQEQPQRLWSPPPVSGLRGRTEPSSSSVPATGIVAPTPLRTQGLNYLA